MARIRSIKPEHWSDKELPNISLQAQLLWIGMWNFADDKGVNEADPFLIRSQIFPRRQDVTIDNINEWIGQLVKVRFLVPFSHKGDNYYITRTFGLHQKIDKPKPSNIPQKVIDLAINGGNQPPTPPLPIDDKSATDRIDENESDPNDGVGFPDNADIKAPKNGLKVVSINDLGTAVDNSTINRRQVGDASATGEERIGEGEDRERSRRGDTPLADFSENLIWDVEKELLNEQGRYESICMKARKLDNLARDSLRKYHLHVVENQGYPKPKESLYAGFEKWLMNEKIPKNANSNSQSTANGKSAGATQLADGVAAKIAARAKSNSQG